MENVLERSEGRAGGDHCQSPQRGEAGVRPQGERMEPLSICGGRVRVETAGRADTECYMWRGRTKRCDWEVGSQETEEVRKDTLAQVWTLGVNKTEEETRVHYKCQGSEG